VAAFAIGKQMFGAVFTERCRRFPALVQPTEAGPGRSDGRLREHCPASLIERANPRLLAMTCLSGDRPRAGR